MYLTDVRELLWAWKSLDTQSIGDQDIAERERLLQWFAEGIKLGYALQKQFTLELIQRDVRGGPTDLRTLSSAKGHPAVQFLAVLTSYNRNARPTPEGLALSQAYRTRLLQQLNPGDVCSSTEPADGSSESKDDGASSSLTSSASESTHVDSKSLLLHGEACSDRQATRRCADPALSGCHQQQPSVLTLPDEVMDKVFELCHPKQKMMVSSACSAFHARWQQERNRLLDQVFPIITLFTQGQFTMFDGFAATLRMKDIEHPDRDVTQQARKLDDFYRTAAPLGMAYQSFFVNDNTVRCMFPGSLYDPTTRTLHARQGGERQIYTGRRGFKHIEIVLVPHIWEGTFAMELFIVSLDGCSD